MPRQRHEQPRFPRSGRLPPALWKLGVCVCVCAEGVRPGGRFKEVPLLLRTRFGPKVPHPRRAVFFVGTPALPLVPRPTHPSSRWAGAVPGRVSPALPLALPRSVSGGQGTGGRLGKSARLGISGGTSGCPQPPFPPPPPPHHGWCLPLPGAPPPRLRLFPGLTSALIPQASGQR